MSKVVRLDDDVYEALLDRKFRMMSISDVVAKMLADLGVEPFDEMEEDDDDY